MKKPSFLSLDDDADNEMESLMEIQVGVHQLGAESSFLDLERGSFDTLRSDEGISVF